MLLIGVLLMLVDIVERIVEIIKSLKNACKTRRKRAKVSPSEIKDINGESPTSDKKPKFSFLDTSNDLWRPSAIEIKKGNTRKIFVPKTSQTRYMYSTSKGLTTIGFRLFTESIKFICIHCIHNTPFYTWITFVYNRLKFELKIVK